MKWSGIKSRIVLIHSFLGESKYSKYLSEKDNQDISLYQAFSNWMLDTIAYYLAIGGLLCFPMTLFFGFEFGISLLLSNAVAYWLLKRVVLLLRNGK